MANPNTRRGNWSGEALAILGAKASTDAGMTELASAVAATGDEAGKAARASLSRSVGSGTAPQVEPQLLERINVADSAGRSTERDWKNGLLSRRIALIGELADDAKRLANAEPETAKSHARSALFLAAGEGFIAGLPLLTRFVLDPTLLRAADLSADVEQKLRALVDHEGQTTARAAAEIASAIKALAALIELKSGWNAAHGQEFTAALDRLANLASGRPDIQWRVANLSWRFLNLAKARGQEKDAAALRSATERWMKAADDGSSGRRWLNEALTQAAPAPTSVGVRIVTMQQLRSARKR